MTNIFRCLKFLFTASAALFVSQNSQTRFFFHVHCTVKTANSRLTTHESVLDILLRISQIVPVICKYGRWCKVGGGLEEGDRLICDFMSKVTGVRNRTVTIYARCLNKLSDGGTAEIRASRTRNVWCKLTRLEWTECQQK